MIAEPEYQCELAANRIAVAPLPHDDDESSVADLATFRESLAASVNLQGSDRYTACVIAPTAAKEWVKGIAYAVVRVQRSTTPGAKRMTVDPVLRTDNHHGPSGDSSCCCSMLGHLTTSLVS